MFKIRSFPEFLIAGFDYNKITPIMNKHLIIPSVLTENKTMGKIIKEQYNSLGI